MTTIATLFRFVFQVLWIIGIVLYCLPVLALEAGFCWAVGSMGFDLLGWQYPARLALGLSVAGVLLVTASIFLFEWWQSSASIPTFEDLAASGRATLANQDDYGKLWTLGFDVARVVEVVNATPEPDGSHRRYFLQVPPGVRTAREAVAWTFGFESAHEYALAVES